MSRPEVRLTRRRGPGEGGRAPRDDGSHLGTDGRVQDRPHGRGVTGRSRGDPGAGSGPVPTGTVRPPRVTPKPPTLRFRVLGLDGVVTGRDHDSRYPPDLYPGVVGWTVNLRGGGAGGRADGESAPFSRHCPGPSGRGPRRLSVCVEEKGCIPTTAGARDDRSRSEPSATPELVGVGGQGGRTDRRGRQSDVGSEDPAPSEGGVVESGGSSQDMGGGRVSESCVSPSRGVGRVPPVTGPCRYSHITYPFPGRPQKVSALRPPLP